MGYPNHKPLPALTKSDIERFWKFVDKRGPKECWPWIGGICKHSRYGNFWLAGKTVIASRVAFAIQHGHDAFPLLVLHECDNRPCCNGKHLKAGTAEQNSFDAWLRTVQPTRKPTIVKPRRPKPRFIPVPVMVRILPSQPERWSPVVGYDRYEVSSHGRVRIVWHKWESRIGKMLAINPDSSGYSITSLWNGFKSTTRLVHCLVAESFIGMPQGRDVNHKDGYKDNPILDNLEYMTRLENCEHSVKVLKNSTIGLRNGKYTKPEATPRGEAHGMAVLNESSVRDIRYRNAMRLTSARAMAREYGVDNYTILSVIHRRTWKHIVP